MRRRAAADADVRHQLRDLSVRRADRARLRVGARSTAEVAEVLELRLDDLRAGYGERRLVRRGIPFRTPTYEAGGHVIWGATARILGDLLGRALGPTRAGRTAARRLAGRRRSRRGICQRSAASRAIRSPSASARLVDDPAHRRVDELLEQHPQPRRRAGRGSGTVPSSQHTIVTPASASISVPMRSGSPT